MQLLQCFLSKITINTGEEHLLFLNVIERRVPPRDTSRAPMICQAYLASLKDPLRYLWRMLEISV